MKKKSVFANQTMRIGLLMLLDALLISASLLMGLQVYYDMHAPAAHILHVWRSLPLLIVSTVALLHMMGFYRGILKYAGVDLLLQIACGTLGGTGITYLVSFLCYSIRREPNIFLMPRPVYLVQWLLLMVMLAASRFVIKVAQGGGWTHFFTGGSAKARRVMVVGGGWGGAQVIRDMQAGRYGDCVPVIVVDDDESRRNTRIGRVRVVMDTGKIAEYAKQYAIDDIIIAIATPKSDLTELMHTCVDTGCHVRRYTVMQEMNGGQGQMRDINIADLLGRDEKHLDMSEVEQVIAGRRVLVTGGGGSIGSEMCRQMMAFIPEKLVLYDISENYMYDLFAELKNKYGEIVKNTVVLRVGSIRDEATLNQVFDEFKPEIVIHAAAHKHVPLMEDSPEQAVRNNVFGTYNVAKCAKEHGAKRFVMISTDKAVNPTNIMGASKRMCERVIQCRRDSGTVFTAVRFGNVLGSSGSVVPLFQQQIAAGGPVTVTDFRVTRYFMTIPEASQLVMQAGAMANAGELFVLHMGAPVHIRSLAENLVYMSGYVPYKSMQIIETGLRPGEKLYEELLTDRETCRKTANDLIYIETEQPPTREEVDGELDILRQAVEASADEVESPLIREALKQVVPTFKEPDEVNRDAENAAEMQNAIDLENPGRARAQKSQDEKEDEKKKEGITR